MKVLGFLLAISVLLNLVQLLTTSNRSQPPAATQQVPAAATARIREVAELCGADMERLRNRDAYETLSDIREILRDAEADSPAVIGKDDLKLLDSYLNNKPRLLAVIKRQNAFAASLRGKRLLILPERKGE